MDVLLNLHETIRELPEENGEYIVFFSSGYATKVNFSKKYRTFNMSAQDEETGNLSNSLFPDFWAEVPAKLQSKLDRKWEEKLGRGMVTYGKERKLDVLATGKFGGRKYAILNLGTHPTAYVEASSVSNYGEEKLSDVRVHWGFTYCGGAYWDENDKSHYLGWDYAHAGDYYGSYTDEEAEYMKCNKRWTTEEIMAEVISVIEQLNKIEGV